MKKLGNWWNDKSLEIYEIDGRKIVLNKWNGEMYWDCFEVSENLLEIISEERFEVKPVYKQISDDEFEIIDYILL